MNGMQQRGAEVNVTRAERVLSVFNGSALYSMVCETVI
jgi:hypothetical protein